MPRKTPPFENYPAWTTAKFWGFIRSGLREKFGRYPPKYEALNAAAEVVADGVYKTGDKKGKPKFRKVYRCAECLDTFMQKDVQVDHIIPAGQLKSFDDLPVFASRLFCKVEDLQVLCKTCHDIKTKQEKENVS
jgi:hypothetical protein